MSVCTLGFLSRRLCPARTHCKDRAHEIMFRSDRQGPMELRTLDVLVAMPRTMGPERPPITCRFGHHEGAS